ncbi:MAG: HD domain-containing protein [Thermoplasmatota archaeon]
MDLPYEIRDPIYGFIYFNDWEKEIIDHPLFQRLRRVKQNALTDFIYPGMDHTRFEHSIGVMKLADDMFNTIRDDKRSNKILSEWGFSNAGLDRARHLIRLASLLHDIGHAPFSHASEKIMHTNTKTGKKFKHEYYTGKLIEEKFKKTIEGHKMNRGIDIKVEDISSFFNGIVPTKNLFWKEIISSQLDADRGDYLQRDSYHGGVKYGVYDLDRLINTLALGIDPEVEEPILGLKEEGWQVAESFILARYKMFSQVYFHKTRRAYDKMLQEAIIHTIGELPDPSNLEEYISLDDYKIWNMMHEDETNEWFKSIIKRDHIRKVLTSNNEEEQKELENVIDVLNDEKIWYWKDDLETYWYDQDMEKEIMLIGKDGDLTLLSNKSNIINNLEPFNKNRLYVKPSDRDKVNKIIDDVVK